MNASLDGPVAGEAFRVKESDEPNTVAIVVAPGELLVSVTTIALYTADAVTDDICTVDSTTVMFAPGVNRQPLKALDDTVAPPFQPGS